MADAIQRDGAASRRSRAGACSNEAVSAVQAGLQTADGDDTGIWRTPFSEMEPHRGGVELAHVLMRQYLPCMPETA